MIRVLLLDCFPELAQKLKSQGFDVEQGTAGYSTGVRQLPCQTYEKDIFIYNPCCVMGVKDRSVEEKDIHNITPEFSLSDIQGRIQSGGTFLVLLNRVSDEMSSQNAAYSWIPFMPSISFTKDNIVVSNPFEGFPDSDCRFLAPIATRTALETPVLLRVKAPPRQNYPRDVFDIFWNGRGDTLGILVKRGAGMLIILPKFRSNDEIIETFLHRVVPKIYEPRTRIGVVDKYIAPMERKALDEIGRLQAAMSEIEKSLGKVRTELGSAQREKVNDISGDPTAKQILGYYDMALRQEDVALFYLYKIIELIEHKYGGEGASITALGLGPEWKLIKKAANASYGDMRHAPKPGDVVKKWSVTEIKSCFEAADKLILAYFGTLFASGAPDFTDPPAA